MGGVCCAGDSQFMRFPDRLPIPDEVLRIAKKLEDAGYETGCVGGAIRDNLLGLENHDFDLTTAAPPDEVRRLFKRTVPVGIEHGTVAVLDQRNTPHEVTTFRKDIRTDGRHAVVEFGVSLMDDLARRDFTINAIAYHPIAHRWQDPFEGAADVGAARIWLPEVRKPANPRGLPDGRGKRETGKVDKLPRDPVLITAYLASDPASLLTRLKCSNRDIERGRAIGAWRDKYPDPRHIPDVRRWLSETGEYANELLALLPAFDVSRFPFPVSRLPTVVASIRAAKDPVTLKDLAVTGDDLLAAGVRPGPDVGETLQRLLAEVLEDPARN